jgi:3-methyladenine DNA glycosylase/8-oxoguanine DNA glycosylase
VHLRVQCRPRWPLSWPGATPDGLRRRRGQLLERLIGVDEQLVLVRAAPAGAGNVLLGAWATSQDAATEAIGRMRFVLGVDDDLRAFHERFRWDPWLGRGLRNDPGLRVPRHPRPFEALAWAICEQLIDFPRATAIQRRIIARLGRRCDRSDLRDAPTAAAIASSSTALLESCDLSPSRSRTLVRVARLIVRRGLDLEQSAPEHGWETLRSIPGVGAWTIEMLALRGQGRLDQLPAGDLNLLKLVGRRASGDPHARAGEEEVREAFAPYAPYQGLAACYAMRLSSSSRPVRSPARAGTRRSSPSRPPVAA